MNRWVRTRPEVTDAGIGLVVLLVYLPFSGIFDGLARHVAPVWLLCTGYVAIGLALSVPFALYRSRPVLAAGIAVPVVGAIASTGATLACTLACVLHCTLVVRLINVKGRRFAGSYAAAATVVYFGLTGWTLLTGPYLSLVVVLYVLLHGFAWSVGELASTRRAYISAMWRRVEHLEVERDQRARIAVADERNRIAREIHDVLAHSVGIMVAQADGADAVLDRQPELVSPALRAIGTTGRHALHELRALVGVLRPGDQDSSEYRVQPVIALERMAERVRGLGVGVSLSVSGEWDRIPTGIALAVHRIVQESLTNSVKYGGRDTEIAVSVGHNGGQVEIEVTDNNRLDEPSGHVSSGGNGLLGMRERTAAYGGTFDAGPCSTGGWRVCATLPARPVPPPDALER